MSLFRFSIFQPITIFSFCIILCNGESDELKTIYTAVAPKFLSSHSTYNVTITLEADKSSNINALPLAFHLRLNCSNTIFKGEVPVIYPGKSAVDSILIKEIPKIQDYCNLTIIRETLSGHKEQDSIIIQVNQKESSVLVQTDKPIYKPGETVHFRIILLNRHLRPIDGHTVNITIHDPQNNVIKKWRDASVQIGLFSSKFVLSHEPNLGDWKIEANYKNEKLVKVFIVEQYVLPKFKVEVKLPPFVTFDSSNLVAEIRATYTYGKPVSGNCTIRLSQLQKYYYHSKNKNQKIVERNIALTEGISCVEFNLLKDLDLEAGEIQFKFDVSITEGVTGRVQNGTNTIKMYEYPYKIEQINVQQSTKPGFPVIYNFKVAKQDNIPISDNRPDALLITHGYSYDDKGYFNSSIPSNGVVTLTVQEPANELISPSQVRVTYKNLTVNFYPPKRILSPSKTYMQVFLKTASPKLGEQIEVFLKANKPFTSMNYIVFSRGEILNSEKFEEVPEQMEHNFTFIMPTGRRVPSSEATLIVYGVFPKKEEIMADSIKISFGHVPLDNFLNISLSDTTVEPGHNVTFRMTTNINSTVAVKAVDQSVLLLKSENDIDEKMLQNELKRLNEDNVRHRLKGGATSFQVFEKAGLAIVTNGELKRRTSNPQVQSNYGWGSYHYPVSGVGHKKKNQKNRPSSTTSPSLEVENSIRLRKDFPETWIWEEIPTRGEITSLTRKVPDTLTSWVISGFALNSESGIGVSLTPNILKTFRPFFLSLNLPYSVVKGETFPLQVLVHNYLGGNITADITLQNSENQFDFVEGKSGAIKQVDILNGEVGSVIFVIVPIKFGIIKLDVKGVTSIAGDALSQPLIVKPPGHKETRNSAIFIDLKAGQPIGKLVIDERPFESVHMREYIKQHLTAEFPAIRVRYADAVKITVIGDLMGASVTNLDKLIQMPTGCGEQNMLKFVPDIVILDYLRILDTLTLDIESKAIGYLESGYQRQLTYMHEDGSFSTFGKSDASGSTWLTAFVVKSFAAAAKYITIDETVIQKGVNFLIDHQQKDGEFIEVGRVIQSDIQGGASGSGVALTSYITLSLIEVSKVYPEINSSIAIKTGLDYMAAKYLEAVNNTYGLNLAAYVFHRVNHAKKDEIFHLVEQRAKINGEYKFWERGNTTQTRIVVPIKPVSVEMTAYALMTYLIRDRVTSSVPVARWLLQQRNPNGGFMSTQDTVVGLAALAKFALITSSPNPDMKIEALYDGQGQTQDIFVNRQNAFVLQEFFIPGSTRTVRFEAEGRGTALAQLSWSYYIETPAVDVFDLRVKVLEHENPGTMLLQICNRFLNPERSNLAVMEVHLPSGYYFDAETLGDIKNVKRHEFEESDTKLNIYFDYFSNITTCYFFRANRVFLVANPANASVLVYDYYDNTRRGIAFYEPPQLNVCDICNNEISCQAEKCVFLKQVFTAIANQTV